MIVIRDRFPTAAVEHPESDRLLGLTIRLKKVETHASSRDIFASIPYSVPEYKFFSIYAGLFGGPLCCRYSLIGVAMFLTLCRDGHQKSFAAYVKKLMPRCLPDRLL